MSYLLPFRNHFHHKKDLSERRENKIKRVPKNACGANKKEVFPSTKKKSTKKYMWYQKKEFIKSNKNTCGTKKIIRNSAKKRLQPKSQLLKQTFGLFRQRVQGMLLQELAMRRRSRL